MEEEYLSIKGISTLKQYKLNHRTNKNGVIERKCSQCGQWKEENYNNYYMKNKSKPELGYSPECKECAIVRTKKNTSKDPDKVLNAVIDWQNKNKERFLTTQHEYNKKRKDKQREYTSDYIKEHPEKQKVYVQNHRNHDITNKEWQENLKAFDYCCAYCGLPAKEHIVKRNNKYIIMELHKEHVEDDGYNDVRNCTPACQSCNSIKGGKTIDELFQLKFIKGFTQEKYDRIIWWTTEGYKDIIEEKPPYRIMRKKNADKRTYHFELWTVDEYRNLIECIHKRDKRNEIIEDIINGIVKIE